MEQISSAVPVEIAERLTPDFFLSDSEQAQLDADQSEALEEIVSDLMLYGQFPGLARNKEERRMSLNEWVADYMDGFEVADFFSRFMCGLMTAEQVEDETKALEKRLREWLKDDELVKVRAREIAFEREDV